MSASLLLSAVLFVPGADPTPAELAKADEMIHKYLAAETARLSKTVLDGAKTKAEWEAKRPKLKQQFLDMMGLWPLPEKTPLKATVTGTLERGDVVIENLHYQSKPGLYVTGNLYRPKGNDKKLPAILCVCGHSGKGRDGNKTAYQDHGLWFASNGYVCLVVDTLQLGEVAGKHHGTYGLRETNPVQTRFWWHSRGYTPAGVECWNGVRGIDYLCSRDDVDPERIGVTGISGGGATTCWVAAADDRVKVAVPVSGMSDLESYVTNKVINGHCDCMFGINYHQWEWTTILALHAPKPLLFANSDNDSIFPMDGNRRIIARLRQSYEMLGAKDKVDEYVSVGGHDYRPDLRVAIFQFINTHLKGDRGPVKDANFAKIEGKELRVFPEDKDLPKDQINDKADELFVAKAEVKLPERKEDFAAWKAELQQRVKTRCLPNLSNNLPAPKLLKEVQRHWQYFTPEADVATETRWFPTLNDDQVSLVIVTLNPDEDAEEEVKYWRKQLGHQAAVATLRPRGGGLYRWTRKSPPNTVERSLPLLGQTADSGRVRDLVASYGKISYVGHTFVILAGRGQAGIITAYAAPYFAETVFQVAIADPPASHRDGPHFLGVQQVLDIPEALGLLAPDTRLKLIGATDKAFDKTAAIYKLAGAEGKFERK